MHEWPADESDWKHSLKWIREWEELGWGEYQESPVWQTAAEGKTSTGACRDRSKRSFGTKTRIPFHLAQAINNKFIYTAPEKILEGPKRSKGLKVPWRTMRHWDQTQPSSAQSQQPVSKTSFLTKGPDLVPENNEARWQEQGICLLE